jgi:hypothetical protein
MKKRIGVILIFIMFFGVNVTAYENVKSTNDTIYVPDDYPTIQEAINNANSGDTVFVRNGIYNETILINSVKSDINLIGEDRHFTKINGTLDSLVCDGTLITIKNFNFLGNVNNDKTVYLRGDGANFSNCIAYKIQIKNSFVEINNNEITGLSIQPDDNKNVDIKNNNIDNIFITDCSNILIENNTIMKEISIWGCDYCNIINNVIFEESSYGIYIAKSPDSNSSNNKIAYNEILNKEKGIFNNGDFTTIESNIINNNTLGIVCKTSNAIINENILNNNIFGISINSDNNNIEKNIFFDSGGIDIMYGNNNNIIYNEFNNSFGVALLFSNYTTIKNNNFLNKNIENSATFFSGEKNKWINNYWNTNNQFPVFIKGKKYINFIGKDINWFNIDWRPAKEPFDISE